MSAARDKFLKECGYDRGFGVNARPDPCAMLGWGDQLPCYASRITVNDEVNTVDRVRKLLRYSKGYIKEGGAGETMFMYSVTEKDDCWKAWASFAEDNPETFSAIVETKSRHRPTYKVRLYIVVKKPSAKR